MSAIEDIREFMKGAAGPVKPAEVAEALELDPKAVRSAMYQAAAQGAGIEKDDDGSYSLIPNWKPRARGGEVEAEAAPAAASHVVPEHPQARVARKATAPKVGKPKAARESKPARKPREVTAKRQPRQAKAKVFPRRREPRVERQPAAAPIEAPIAQFHTILLPRQTVRLLVAGVLAFGGVLGDELRAAVLEATKEAA